MTDAMVQPDAKAVITEERVTVGLIRVSHEIDESKRVAQRIDRVRHPSVIRAVEVRGEMQRRADEVGWIVGVQYAGHAPSVIERSASPAVLSLRGVVPRGPIIGCAPHARLLVHNECLHLGCVISLEQHRAGHEHAPLQVALYAEMRLQAVVARYAPHRVGRVVERRPGRIAHPAVAVLDVAHLEADVVRIGRVPSLR